MSLERECRVFARHLTGSAPTPYVVERYLHAHRVGLLPDDPAGFDGTLVRFARSHRLATRIADGYARLFVARSVLRDKLVLLLSLLETSAPSHRWIDGVPPGGRPGTLALLVFHGLAGTVCTLVGVLLLTPARLLAGRRSRGA